MALTIDTSTEFGAQVARRLESEQVGWLTTVRADGLPQPTPVWFHWDGETMLVFSEPTARKVLNLAENPKASLHFNCGAAGGDVVVFAGTATVTTELPADARQEAYLAKYAEGVKQLGLTRESLLKTYSAVIYLTPSRVSGH